MRSCLNLILEGRNRCRDETDWPRGRTTCCCGTKKLACFCGGKLCGLECVPCASGSLLASDGTEKTSFGWGAMESLPDVYLRGLQDSVG